MQIYKVHPLKFYVIAASVAWIIVLCLVFFVAPSHKFHDAAILCAGFYFGLLAMFLAANLYRSKSIWKNQNRLNESDPSRIARDYKK